MKKTATLLAAAGIAVFGLAACGSDDDDSGDSASSGTASTAETTAADSSGQTLTITAEKDPSVLEFTTDAVNAKAGPTTIELDNPSTTPHELEVKSADGDDVGEVEPISEDKGSFTANLEPGTYEFVCDLPGHAATMHGTINVK